MMPASRMQSQVVLLILWGALSPRPFVSAAELPVRSVALYKHGVGYFERSGSIAPGESVRLEFAASDMNDVLKSLTLSSTGGAVTGLRYDSSFSLERKLDAFPFRIEPGQPLSAVVDQLKGARIELDLAGQKLAGAIVSARLLQGDKDHAEREQLTLLTDSGELRNVDLAAASSLHFSDAGLQQQFREYLQALTGLRSKELRSLYIDAGKPATATKQSEVKAEYILPMPAWKSSYRLVFSDNAAPTLEGWAIVDNTTSDDWTSVRLSLVSGRPISFISQLYPPRFIQRQGAELAQDAAVAPPVYGGAIAGASFAEPQNAAKSRAMAAMAAPAPPPAAPRLALSSIAPETQAQEIADLFEYTLASPVTIRRNESAMLPFLQQKIAGRKLDIYSDSSRVNPFSAAELTNNTGKTLDGGPITVFDGGTYAGEALVETFKTGDKRFLSYGFDLGMRITTGLNSRSDAVREVHAHNGVLTSRSSLVEKKTYSIRNVDPRAKVLVLEHPVRTAFHLIETPAPLETARDVYRFEVKVPPTASLEFPVTEENLYDSQISVSSLTPDSLTIWVRNKALTDSARVQLQQVLDLKTRLAAVEADKRAAEEEIANAEKDEQRTRQNIASLSPVAQQQAAVQDYARKLTELETRIAGVRDRHAGLERQIAGFQSQLNSLLARLEF